MNPNLKNQNERNEEEEEEEDVVVVVVLLFRAEEGRQMKKKKKITVSGVVLMSYKIACRAGKQQQMEELDQRGL